MCLPLRSLVWRLVPLLLGKNVHFQLWCKTSVLKSLKLPILIEVEMAHSKLKSEGPNVKPSSSRLGTYQGQFFFPLIHKPSFQNEWVGILPNSRSEGQDYFEHCLICQAYVLTSKIRSMTPTWLWLSTCMSICKPPTVKDSCQPSKYERFIQFSFMFSNFYQLDICNKIVLHLKIYNEASTKIIPPLT